MQKSLIAASVIFLTTIFLTSCSLSPKPATQTSVPLAIDEEKVSLEFQQNGSSLPISREDQQWNITLKAEPFTLLINGNKKIITITALKSAELIEPLQSSALVSVSGTGLALSQHNLYMSEQLVETYELTQYTLQNLEYFNFPAEKAVASANTLKKQFGKTPQILLSGRAYIGYTLSAQNPNYTVETINEKPIESGQSIVLLVFIEKESNDSFFKMLQWVRFDLKFQ